MCDSSSWFGRLKTPPISTFKALSSKTLSKLFYNKGRTSQVSRQKHRELLHGQRRVVASIPALAHKA
jgi:hypothetical protein